MSKSCSATSEHSSSDSDARSIGLGIPGSAIAFSVMRRVDPAAAFDELVAHVTKTIENDPDVAKTFEKIQNFDAVFVQASDRRRLEELAADGTAEFDLKVGTLPKEIGPGLALLYDAALKTLATSDQPIDLERIDARVVQRLAQSFDSFVEMVGSASVQAIEMAMADKDLAGRLVDRAKRLGKSFQRAPQQQGPCEFCTISIKDRNGNITSTRCGTEEECRAMGLIGLILLLILLLGWIFSWF